MRALKKTAQEEGILTPFYTCTGWGGAAAALDEMIPLWGGYYMYSTYSGRLADMDGNVKFIIETAPIEKDE